MIKLDAKQLRESEPTQQDLKKIKRNPIYIVLEDVLDTYNVGSIFRLADAVSVKQVFLCGKTETPPNIRIKKAAVGTQNWVEWEYVKSASLAIKKLRQKEKNLQVYAVEQSKRSVAYDKVEYKFPLAIVMGHETNGVSKGVLKLSDSIVEIPMFGINKSLNVMVASAIVLFEMIRRKSL